MIKWCIHKKKEAIAEIESRDTSTKELSQNDSLAQVLGKEHPGRVRGLGSGPSPTQLFGHTSQSSCHGVNIHEYQKEIAALQAETAEAKKKSQTMEHLIRFLIQRQGDDLPPEIASEMKALDSGVTTSDASPSSETPDL
ncbi:hypothetical protein PIB30_017180 [Stylosanthes scabra]|uniref:Uncharacterized protein n=1 Tax=Stylosanthes scabra TaxID=79078 RepID=A0ABU6X6Q9_9FABA|nr:hypothetical protein [Stylosanthes scabra]